MSSLLDSLGIDPEDFIWEDLALCKGLDPNSFFDSYEKDVEVAKAVDQACLRCPVVKDCFFKGSDGEYGVWGGVYWNGSGSPDKNKNSHKTQDDWNKLELRLNEQV